MVKYFITSVIFYVVATLFVSAMVWAVLNMKWDFSFTEAAAITVAGSFIVKLGIGPELDTDR